MLRNLIFRIMNASIGCSHPNMIREKDEWGVWHFVCYACRHRQIMNTASLDVQDKLKAKEQVA